jgi:hypothetical protein
MRARRFDSPCRASIDRILEEADVARRVSLEPCCGRHRPALPTSFTGGDSFAARLLESLGVHHVLSYGGGRLWPAVPEQRSQQMDQLLGNVEELLSWVRQRKAGEAQRRFGHRSEHLDEVLAAALAMARRPPAALRPRDDQSILDSVPPPQPQQRDLPREPSQRPQPQAQPQSVQPQSAQPQGSALPPASSVAAPAVPRSASVPNQLPASPAGAAPLSATARFEAIMPAPEGEDEVAPAEAAIVADVVPRGHLDPDQGLL